MKKTLSLCMIVKNEENVIARCLKCASLFADEIILVDTGSTDKTKEIASIYTKKIYDFPWIDDFSAARNFAFSKAKCDYVMWLDADDVVTDDNAVKILNLLQEVTADTVMCRYHVSFDVSDKPVVSYYRERILKNNAGFVWEGFVHEAITPRGEIIYTDIEVEHRKKGAPASGRNLAIYRKKIAEGYKLNARHTYYYARELYYNGVYSEAEAELNRFISEGQGYLPNVIDAHFILKKCADALGDNERGAKYLFSVLKYTVPTAEFCCEAGHYFFNKADYQKAIYWYNKAMESRPDLKSGAFINAELYGLIPALSLCVCYDRMGDKVKAKKYNDLAAAFNQFDARVLHNKSYFEKLNIV